MTTLRKLAYCLLISVSAAAVAQTRGKTNANVNLRSGPSMASSRVTTLPKDSLVTLLQTGPTNGFYHVRTSDKVDGWVKNQYVAVSTATSRALVRKPTNFEVEPHAIGLAAAACATNLASCATNGCSAADSPHGLMNELKEAVPTATTPVLLTFDDFASLQQQADALLPEDKELSASDRAQLKSLTVAAGSVSEGDLVSIVGYMVGTPHPNTGESVNCNLKGESNNDYHIPISNDPANSDFQGIVVEMIPQSRPANWSLANLTQVESGGQLVMVTGGLFYDNLHKVNGDQNNPLRGQPARFALFEVHPITQFVVCTKADNSCNPAAATDWAPLGGGA
jgi:uncharacterized protein YgiM (DUF1202 family)